jgi:hypothetical protein
MVCLCVTYLPDVNKIVPGAALTSPRDDQEAGVYLRERKKSHSKQNDVITIK